MKRAFTVLLLIFTIGNIYPQIGWFQQNSGLSSDLWSVSTPDSLNYWAVGGTAIIRTTNGGKNWTNQTNPTSYGLCACKFVNVNTGWISGNEGVILKTTNGGSNWFTQNSGTSAVIWALYFIDANTGFYGNIIAQIFKTTNGGTNWFLQTTINGMLYSNFSFINNNTGWVATGNYPTSGKVYKTTNGGTNWFIMNTGTISMTEDVCFVNENTGWVSGNNGMIIKTTNGGNNWFSQSSGTSSTLLEIFFVNQNTGWAVGSDNTYTNGTILKTTNSGVNWITQLNTTPLYAVDFYNEYIGIAVGRNGVVYKTLTGGELFPLAPNLISPLNDSKGVLLTQALTWDSISGATGYILKIYSDSLYANLIDSATILNTQYSIPEGKLSMGNKYYWKVAGYNIYGVGLWSTIWRFTAINNLTLNLKVYLEGLWNGITQVSDTVKVYLANGISPCKFADSSIVLLSTDGTGTLNFTKCENDNYYIVVIHRNHLETWSRFPKPFSANVPVSYNFTTAPTQAYGNNMIFSNGGYCIYGGDINQDGFVDGSDMALLDNDLFNYGSGYLITDINGDQFVDGTDMAILDNNLYNYIGVVRPGGKDANQRSVILKLERNQNKTIWNTKEKSNQK